MNNLLRQITSNVGFKHRLQNSKAHYSNMLLESIGNLESPMKDGSYSSGQLILNKVFGYRGVILSSWTTRVFDESATIRMGKLERERSVDFPDIRTVTKRGIFYQVLVDARDWPYIKSQMITIPKLQILKDDLTRVYTIPGIDYVSHDDIIPYRSNQRIKFQHCLFNQFFDGIYEDSQFKGKEALNIFKEKCLPWLKLSNVHKRSTENVRMTVIPFYVGRQGYNKYSDENVTFWWCYYVRLENLSNMYTLIKTRSLKTLNCNGELDAFVDEEELNNGPKGMVMPFLSRQVPACQYVRYVSLAAPIGQVWGEFQMIRGDGLHFDCMVPPFTLRSRKENAPLYR